MPQVIQIRRQPNGWDRFGQGVESALDKYMQGNMQMAKEQNVITHQMLQHALSERRLADQNTRDDRRWNETREMQQARFAQEDKWKAEQLALQKQQLGMQQSEKAQARALNDKVMKMLSGGGTMGGSPVDADFTAALNGSSSGGPALPSFNLAPQEDGFGTGGAGGMGGAGLPPAPSLSFEPSNSQLGFPPAPQGQSPTITPDPFGVQAPSFMMKPNHAPAMGANPDLGNAQGMSSAAPASTPSPSPQTQQAVDNLRRAYEEIGGIDPAQLTPEQQEIVTWGKAMGFEQPSSPAMPQMPAPASMNGLTVQNFPMELMTVPAGKAAFEKLKQMDDSNRQRYQDEMKVYETAQKQTKAEKADAAKQDSIVNLSRAALRSADESLNLLEKNGTLATGSQAKAWMGKEDSWMRKLGFGQNMDNLHRALQPMQTATMMEMIRDLKNQSANGALNMRITQLEAVMLSGILGSLELDQDPAQLKKNIIAHRQAYQEAMDIAREIQGEKGYVPRQGNISSQRGTSTGTRPPLSSYYGGAR